MNLIDYDKYAKIWSPRAVITLLVVEATSTGLFLGVALMEVAAKSSGWIFPLVLGFGSALGVVQTTLLALHNSQTTPERQNAVATAH
jgi:hypothetical protein